MAENVVIPLPNAAPQSVLLGVNDIRGKSAPRVPQPVPQHVPKFYLRTPMGVPGKDVFGNKADLVEEFGDDAFEVNGKFSNHQTLGATVALKNANSIIVHRIVGDSAAKAGVLHYVTIQKKNGANKVGYIDSNGYVDPQNNATATDYYEVTWGSEFAAEAPKTPKTFVEADADAAGSRVDIMYISARNPGAYGNNYGLRLAGNKDEDLDPRTLSEDKVLPFYAGMVSRPNALSSGSIVNNQDGIKLAPASWNPNAKDRLTGESIYVKDIYDNKYANDGSNGLPVTRSPLGEADLYQDEIDKVLSFLFKKEQLALKNYTSTNVGTGQAPYGGTPATAIGTSLPTPVSETENGQYYVLTEKSGSNKKGTYHVRELSGRYVKAKEKTEAEYTTNNPGASKTVAAPVSTRESTPPAANVKGDYYVYDDGNTVEIWVVAKPTTYDWVYENSNVVEDPYKYDHSNDETQGSVSISELQLDRIIDEQILEGDAESSRYLINFLSGNYSSGKAYLAIDVMTMDTVGRSSTAWLGYGKDDDVDVAGKAYTKEQIRDTYETKVGIDLDRYLDKEDRYQNLALSIEKDFYDTGFTIGLKKKMAKVIGRRKDTSLVVGTFTEGDPALNVGQEKSIAAMLYVALTGYAESDYFGTKTSRAMIATLSGKIPNHPFKGRVSSVIDLIDKFSSYMGAGSGKWNPDNSPEGIPGALVNLYDINVDHIPVSNRIDFWAKGANFLVNYDKDAFSWPAYKTVYPYDNSVLTGKLINSAIQTLEICLDRAQREFSGRTDLTDASFEAAVKEFLEDQLVHYTFDSRYIIEPHVSIKGVDKLRRFSWLAWYTIKGGVGKTVQTSYIESSVFDEEA